MARENVYYVSGNVKPGDDIRWSNLEPERCTWRENRDGIDDQILTLIPHCTFGDYDNSTDIERSNHRSVVQDPDMGPHVVQVHGSHGSQAVGYLGTEPPCQEIADAIASLESYPILDEHDCSELGMQMEGEAWNDHGESDFRHQLLTHLDTIDPAFSHELALDDEDSTRLYGIWHDGCDAYNVNGGNGYQIESGGGVRFYTEEWIKRAGESEHPHHPRSEWSRKSHAKMESVLIALAHETRGELAPGVDTEMDTAVEIALVACERLLRGVADWTPADASDIAIERCNAAHARLTGPSVVPSKEGLLAA